MWRAVNEINGSVLCRQAAITPLVQSGCCRLQDAEECFFFFLTEWRSVLGDDSSKGFTFFKVILGRSSSTLEQQQRRNWPRMDKREMRGVRCVQEVQTEREMDGILCSYSVCMHIFTSVKFFLPSVLHVVETLVFTLH